MQQTHTLSALHAMHQRFEANSMEYTAIDAALTEARQTDDHDKHKLENAQQASVKEADALRLAILYQVPRTMMDAAILQFHMTDMFDLVRSCEERRDAEEEALRIATLTMLDFLACEMKVDHRQTVGNRFADDAVNVHFATRHRTGEMGE